MTASVPCYAYVPKLPVDVSIIFASNLSENWVKKISLEKQQRNALVRIPMFILYSTRHLILMSRSRCGKTQWCGQAKTIRSDLIQPWIIIVLTQLQLHPL